MGTLLVRVRVRVRVQPLPRHARGMLGTRGQPAGRAGWLARRGFEGQEYTAHAANTCTVGERSDHCGELASSGSSRMRLSSCTGYMAMRTVAATFHVGGGAIRSRRPSSPLASPLEGSQPGQGSS